jgi:dephospho-CoA kinase
MKVIGLTGGIGTGKSTVGRLLTERHGVPVVDADFISREVVAVGTPGLRAVAHAFGDDILSADGTLDRAAMRQRIMMSPTARSTLEAILHPLIFDGLRARLATLAEQGHAAAVVEAALMVETGSYRHYDALWVVSAAPEVQIQRVVARDHQTPEDAAKVLAAQLPMADKEALATVVIRNDSSLASLSAAVDEAWRQTRVD